MKLLVAACISALVLMAVACGSPEGEVTGKKHEPAWSGIEYTVECGLAIDGSFDCGKLKPKYMSRPERWWVITTEGRASVSRDIYDSCDIGDWYEGSRCRDERP